MAEQIKDLVKDVVNFADGTAREILEQFPPVSAREGFISAGRTVSGDAFAVVRLHEGEGPKRLISLAYLSAPYTVGMGLTLNPQGLYAHLDTLDFILNPGFGHPDYNISRRSGIYYLNIESAAVGFQEHHILDGMKDVKNLMLMALTGRPGYKVVHPYSQLLDEASPPQLLIYLSRGDRQRYLAEQTASGLMMVRRVTARHQDGSCLTQRTDQEDVYPELRELALVNLKQVNAYKMAQYLREQGVS